MFFKQVSTIFCSLGHGGVKHSATNPATQISTKSKIWKKLSEQVPTDCLAPGHRDVTCGGHSASQCEKCPFGPNGSNMGESWCNGECHWMNGGCRPNKNGNVTCGGHSAPNCESCPWTDHGPFGPWGDFHGEKWCHGECQWRDEKCRHKLDGNVTCGGHTAPHCERCPWADPWTPGGNFHAEKWCHGECQWREQQAKCLPREKPDGASKVASSSTQTQFRHCPNYFLYSFLFGVFYSTLKSLVRVK